VNASEGSARHRRYRRERSCAYRGLRWSPLARFSEIAPTARVPHDLKDSGELAVEVS
jgi:hypothetical protein